MPRKNKRAAPSARPSAPLPQVQSKSTPSVQQGAKQMDAPQQPAPPKKRVNPLVSRARFF